MICSDVGGGRVGSGIGRGVGSGGGNSCSCAVSTALKSRARACGRADRDGPRVRGTAPELRPWLHWKGLFLRAHCIGPRAAHSPANYYYAARKYR